MDNKELQGIITLSIGGILFIVSIISSALFAQKIPFGEYIFTVALIIGLILMFIGIRKMMKHIVSKR